MRAPTLVEVTNQLANPDDEQAPAQRPQAPQVVFVSSESCCDEPQQDCQSVVGGEAKVVFAAAMDCTTQECAIAESFFEESDSAAFLASESIADQSENQNQTQTPEVDEVEQSVDRQIQTLEELMTGMAGSDPMSGAWRHRWFYSEEPRFLLDPFDQAIDGPIPVLPSLPVLKAIEMTENVVSREQKGMHYAWRLKPGPYPDLGNLPQISTKPIDEAAEPASEVEPLVEDTEAIVPNPLADDADWAPDLENWTPQAEPWTQSELVAEGDTLQQGDDFYAQPGDVISIDGNKGYDHIDLRSYALEDAMFQPGAILLNPKSDSESGEPEPPIIIRYRGIGFAIFDGDVKVEL